MTSGLSNLTSLVLALAVVATGAAVAQGQALPSDVRVEAVRETLDWLAAFPSRVPGTEGHDAAVARLIEEIRAVPGVRVWEHRFAVVVPRTLRAELTVAEGPLAGVHRIHPLWPAGARLNTTPAEGISGRPIYIGRAEYEEIPPKSLRGQIAVMELCGGPDWRRAAQAGATAIILLDNDEATRTDAASHFTPLTIKMPRFFVPEGPLADALRQGQLDEVTLVSQCAWQEVQATNVYAMVEPREGTAPRPALAIAAQIDSSGVVPDQAPGADAAIDAALALEALRHFAVNRPALPIVFTFFDAQTINQLGARQMLGALSLTPEDRRDAIRRDIDALAGYRQAAEMVTRLAETPQPLAHLNESQYREIHRFIRDEVDLDVVVIESELQNLRLDRIEATDERKAEIDRRMSTLLEHRSRLRAAQRSLLTSRPIADRLRPSAEELWRRAKRRIMQQYEQTAAVVEAVDAGERMRREMLDTLGLTEAPTSERPIEFLFGLDLSDAGVAVGPSRYGRLHYTDETTNFRAFREWIERVAEGDERLLWPEGLRPYVNVRPFTGLSTNTAHLIGSPTTLTSPGVSLGMAGGTWVTLEGDSLRIDTPSDRADLLDWARLRPQIRATFTLLDALGNDADFARDAKGSHPKWSRVTGTVVDSAPGEPVARLPMAGYVTTLVTGRGGTELCQPQSRANPVPGVRRQEFCFTAANGRFRFDLIKARRPNWARLHEVYVQAYKLAEDGSIVRAVDYRRMGRGSLLHADVNSGRKNDTLRAVPFTCREICAFGLVDARFLMPLESGSLLDARSLSAPKRSNVTLQNGMMASLVEPELDWVFVLRAGITRNRMALLNVAPMEDADATARDLVQGFAPHRPLPRDPVYQAARDWYRLDAMRLEQYRRAGITSAAIERTRERTGELLDQTRDAIEADDGRAFERNSTAALANESAAYQAALATADDTIRGAVFLLLVLVPFAFAMERLLVASSRIYHQIPWTLGIFVVMTAVLWSFHPAFRISSQPLTVIMAFAIICLAVLVISMVYGKFSSELEKMRSGRAEESGARTSRLGVLSTAVRLGIANMRKRKLRTMLTGLTVVLITFALLCFVSTSKYESYREYALDAPAEFTGVLLRNAGGRPLPKYADDSVRAAIGPDRPMASRQWWVHTNENWRLHTYCADLSQQTEFAAALGLSPEESLLSAVTDVLRDWDRFAEGGGCYMAEARAGQLGVTAGDTVLVAGQPLKLIGVFDAAAFDQTLYDLDGMELTPANYGALSQQEKSDIGQTNLARLAHAEGSGSAEGTSLPRLPSETVLIVPAQWLVRYASDHLRSIAIPASDAADARELAKQLADRYAFVVTYGAEGSPAAILARVPLVPTAPRSLIVPLLIGGLIIFNTMLSSLAERRREIYVYTSLGLAPLHVGFLFLAEAMTYGLMGTVFGYVVGQGVASLLSALGWLGDITLNYSGSQAIMIMLMVLGVVMVSSLVPAWLAGRLAAPSNVRTWTVPKPEGDVIRDALPFTVTARTASGVAAFMREFLDAHREGVIGDFSTDDLRPLPPAGAAQPGFGIAATVWLAPYDLGVRQDVRLMVEPAEGQDIFGIHVYIERASGSVGTWHKLNHQFLGSLRRQLLGWRNLTTERVLAYIEEGEAVRARLLGTAAADKILEATGDDDSDGIGLPGLEAS